ncbi:MAG: aldehyde dehydrogenase family protein [Salibacteraceae bacterium]|nr:aldehyde dehydrogenase family protein [Salibacteraceae bacterium]|tara:strand:- start:3202 stop:4587 length:1386 start_codon:yes stop_codon:yes gene_type:complete
MLKVNSPYTQEQIGEYPLVPMKSIEGIIQTAYSLFEDRSQWLKPHERKTILQRCARIMESRIEELTKLAANEGGKPLNDSKVEVLRAINGVEIAAENIAELKGGEIPMGLTSASEGRVAFTQREPIGVVASVSAFNHPLNLIIHQVVTAVAAGCPVIVKPAPTTPMSCEALVGILKEAGLPEGWCQMVICENDVAERLITDTRINYFSFIGSAKVGWYLRSKLSAGTRCALEHGGAAPVIVEPDADFEEMIPSLIKGGFYHAGQVCVSVQRVFAHKSICKKLAQEIASGAQKLKVGDPLDASTEVGPLILPREVDRVEEWVNEAVEAGAEVLCGGRRISATCFEPTVLFNPPATVRVSTSEIFGPVVCIYSYTDRAEAIETANSLDVHFQASIFTKNIDVALESVQKLNATAVMVNDHTAFRVDWMPFGGRDSSGIGMGGIQYSMHEMTREKLMVIKSNLL